jgi:hypothetical protein
MSSNAWFANVHLGLDSDDIRLVVNLPAASAGSVQRLRCKAIRACIRGYEYGYYVVGPDGARAFARVGVSRSYEHAVLRLEKL